MAALRTVLLLTLLVTPVIYSLFDDAKQFSRRKHGAVIQEEAPAALPAEENVS